MKPAFDQFKDFLREMFQYDTNDLNFGIFKILKHKRKYIEQFISGDGPDDLKATVDRELARVELAEDNGGCPRCAGENRREIVSESLIR